jgi:hypothetical protein
MVRAKKKRPAGSSKTAAKSKAAAKKKATAKKARPRQRTAVTYKFVITVENGKIGFDATSDDGNGFAPERASERDRFEWNISHPDYEFELVFKRVKCKGAGAGANWPFPGVPRDSTGWVRTFSGDAKNPGLYKYTVRAQHRLTKVPLDPLDPIIIVGRRV